MSTTHPAPTPTDTGSDERRRLIHYTPDRVNGRPAPWTALCGKPIGAEAVGRPKTGVPYCVVCLSLYNTRGKS